MTMTEEQRQTLQICVWSSFTQQLCKTHNIANKFNVPPSLVASMFN